jgi:SAM-dependent methyltransferase
VFDGRLYLAPLSHDNPPRKILDVATGTGRWAIEMADEFPDAKVIGTDLSPIQPTSVPPNLEFIIDDGFVSTTPLPHKGLSHTVRMEIITGI